MNFVFVGTPAFSQLSSDFFGKRIVGTTTFSRKRSESDPENVGSPTFGRELCRLLFEIVGTPTNLLKSVKSA
ncbi:hypothetical protein LEP1GSC052_2043 [Leptospira kmetyi serovar Malaysia str. Bejo-Iso9]|nr:hypothetical protein LEP1GSC052_2043 [Leptospira kmetyi serovar Malaysia str. Bejo-Iso9]